MGNPKLLLPDEPTEGVGIGVIEEITNRLIELAKEIAVIIIEQRPWSRMHLANHVYELDLGRVALRGAAGDVGGNPKLLR
ncbi:ABC-type branched-subunit amino acid transport system ATPase component [Bradyrhizobium sp. GM22.5]